MTTLETLRTTRRFRAGAFRQMGWAFMFLWISISPNIRLGQEFTSGKEPVAMKPKVQLELVGRLPRKPGGRVGCMTLHANHVYLVNEDAGLQVVDVSNPAVVGWADRS